MKKLIFITIYILCLFTALTVSASRYIVELNTDITETGADNTESFEEINVPSRYVYTTEDIDSIRQLEQKGIVVYYEEDVPLVFEEDTVVTPSKNISVIDDVYEPVSKNGDISIMSNTFLQEVIDPNTLPYAVFTNNLIAGRIPKGNYKVRVGIIDSGICVHDGNGNLRSDFINVVDGISFVDNEPFKDETNHGTPCAGLIGSQYLGVAPDCEMISLKAFNDKEGYLGDIIKAIYAGVDDYGCKVLNISAGAENTIAEDIRDELKAAINYATKSNVIVVAAVGNIISGNNNVMYPANFPRVTGVGSVNSDGGHSYFSRVNTTVDVCAIGHNVLVPVSRDKFAYDYRYMSGTSFSAPQVSGLAALLCSYDYDITPGEFDKILKATCFDPGDLGRDTTFGDGIIDVKEAFEFATQKPLFYTSRIFKSGNNVNYKIYNNTSVSQDVSVITANYDYLGRVINYEPVTKTVNSKKVLSLSEEITCDFSQGEYFRLMLWETFDDMSPLCRLRDYYFSD